MAEHPPTEEIRSTRPVAAPVDDEPPSKRRRRLTIAVAVLAVVVVIVLVVLGRRPPAIALAEVRRESVDRILAMTGEVEPALRVKVQPEVPGTVVELRREEGETVTKGEPLVRIESGPAEAVLAQTRAALAARKRQLEQARRDLARQEKLLSRHVVSEADVEASRVQVSSGEADVARLAAAVAEAKKRVGQFSIAAPLTGVVVSRPIDPGQVVGTQTVIYEIATQGQAHVESDVDEQYLRALKVGMPAIVMLPGDPEKSWRAHVSWVAPQVDVQTGGGIVKLAFDAAAPDLPLGLSVDVNVKVERRENAVTVPRTAVLDPRNDPHVLVIDSGRVAARKVSVIDWPAERVVVTEGLSPGDRVIADPRSVHVGARARARAS